MNYNVVNIITIIIIMQSYITILIRLQFHWKLIHDCIEFKPISSPHCNVNCSEQKGTCLINGFKANLWLKYIPPELTDICALKGSTDAVNTWTQPLIPTCYVTIVFTSSLTHTPSDARWHTRTAMRRSTYSRSLQIYGLQTDCVDSWFVEEGREQC